MWFDQLLRFSVPTEIVYGLNSLRLLGSELKRLGVSKLLFITDSSIKNAGILKAAFDSLEDYGIQFVIFDQCPPDPDTQIIDRIVGELKANGCDCVVGAGGGSILCAAKATALVATNGGNIRDYKGNERYRKAPLPCIGIPTTAGSGSEVSKITIITDELTKHKIGISGFQNAPRVAILDPTVLSSVPKNQAVASGVDALTHAMEAYVSSQASPATDAIALSAIEIITNNFYSSVFTDDLRPKGEMLLASCMANLACGNAGLGLNHAMNAAITYLMSIRGYPFVSYGFIHAILLPHVLEFNLPTRENKFALMAQVMGASSFNRTTNEVARMTIDRLNELLAILDAPRYLPWKNVPREDLLEMARFTSQHGAARSNPRKYTLEELVYIFEKVLQP